MGCFGHRLSLTFLILSWTYKSTVAVADKKKLKIPPSF